MIIREYEQSDLDNCEKLRMKLWSRENKAHNEKVTDFDSEGESSDCELGWNIFVAEDKEQLIGFIETSIKKFDGLVNNHVGYIEGWYIDSNYRNKGLGKLLIIEAENWVKYEGCGSIASPIPVDNEAALELFEKLGYKVISRNDKSYFLKEFRHIEKAI
jgi:aminoglycoside 6'-N-acetyltransferase I